MSRIYSAVSVDRRMADSLFREVPEDDEEEDEDEHGDDGEEDEDESEGYSE
jgi:hypothetical protein